MSDYSPYVLDSRCAPTTYHALAEAILNLARISKQTLVGTTFSGGTDCAWLAAFAEWELSLEVSISDSDGLLLYRSRNSVRDLPQIMIILHSSMKESLPGQECLLRFAKKSDSDHSTWPESSLQRSCTERSQCTEFAGINGQLYFMTFSMQASIHSSKVQLGHILLRYYVVSLTCRGRILVISTKTKKP